jgi:hypothetical protein
MKIYLPKIGDLVLEYNEDSDKYSIYKMFNSISRKGNTLFLLETPDEDYKIATKTNFEPEMSDFLYDPEMIVLKLNNKHIHISTHSKSYSVFTFNVTKNYYEITFPSNHPEVFKNEILELIDKKINTQNFVNYLKNKKFGFNINHNKDEYIFEQI